MDILPAIDIRHGRCVRLEQGDFARATLYEDDPLKQALRFAETGAAWVHVVDLDGAKDGSALQTELVMRMARDMPLKIQTGGGIRDERTVETLLNSGVRRVVIGTLAVTDGPRVRGWLRRFGADNLVMAFDLRQQRDGGTEVLTHGWLNASGISLDEVLDAYAESGLKHILCTDIARDGMLRGCNLDLYRAIRCRWPGIAAQASGGVDALADLAELNDMGVAGVVIGKALYEGRVNLAEALTIGKSAHAR